MAAQGWPFLVARGRQSGYAVRLAPDFLIQTHEYGLLEDGTGTQIVANGRTLAVVRAEHTVTGADVGLAEAPRDEHSRPLHLLYGFVCPDATAVRPSDVDMSRTLEIALDVYRRFLADESGFTLAASSPFPLDSTVAALTTPPVERRRVAPYAVAGLVAAAAVAVIAVMSLGGEDPPPPPLHPAPTTSVPRPTVTSIVQTTARPDPGRPGEQNR
ncbi:hypothetical protein [Kibdelosporangium aridum]|uniref:hypothetical protein n=1 Tax=Kibdelosporangium aridum TaxID=2030 RepID=UPI000F79E479|nr:hypothetical protein [Kibdelosporangium aridum]